MCKIGLAKAAWIFHAATYVQSIPGIFKAGMNHLYARLSQAQNHKPAPSAAFFFYFHPPACIQVQPATSQMIATALTEHAPHVSCEIGAHQNKRPQHSDSELHFRICSHMEPEPHRDSQDRLAT